MVFGEGKDKKSWYVRTSNNHVFWMRELGEKEAGRGDKDIIWETGISGCEQG